jgi:signal transduction histidine kinase/CheY-like chemotaxis protein
MFTILKRNFTKLREMGVNPTLSIEDAKKVQSANTLGFFPMVMYLVYIIFGAINLYYFPVILCSILFSLSLLGLYFNKTKKYTIAKNLLFAINTFAVFITYNSLNIDYTICCYFFPLIMAYEILFDFNKEIRFFPFAILFLISCLLGCLLLPKGIFYYYEMPLNLLKSSQVLNVVIPFFISIIFLYEIFGIHKKTEEQLIQAKVNAENASKAKTEFLNNMSHELRTPLNGIIGSTDLLLNEHMNASQKKYFEIIKYSSDHMLNLVNDILDFSKVQSGKLDLTNNTFNINVALNNICKMFTTLTTSKNIAFEKNIDVAVNTLVETDELRLTQILHNLLSNAIKFTKKGSITLTVKVLQNNAKNMSVYFAVKDTGIGIQEENQLKIFESFTQADAGTSRKYGGTGLGLTISRQLVEKFGGELRIDSKHGEGSTFSFCIVMQKTIHSDGQVLRAIKEHKKYNNELKILLAEDNPINMVVVRSFLKNWEIEVKETTDGLSALKAFKIDHYDMVLLDLEMPVLDGFGAAEEIRRLNNTVPIIAFTAATFENMKEELISKGFNDYICKPFRPNELAEIIKEYSSVNLS